MQSREALEITLSELLLERQQLDQTIDFIQHRLNGGNTSAQAQPQAEARASIRPKERNAKKLPISARECAVAVLAEERRPMTTRQIYDAIIEMGAKCANPNVLYATLKREQSGVVRYGNKWKLSKKD